MDNKFIVIDKIKNQANLNLNTFNEYSLKLEKEGLFKKE